MRNLLILAIFLITVSCRKEQTSDNIPSYCSDCLLGKWELSSGVKIIGKDTFQVFENGQIITFSYGKREPYKYAGHLNLDIRRDSFIYDELIEDYFATDDVVKYNDRWQFLNTTLSNTLLKLRVRFNPANDVSIFKIENITDKELNIIHSSSWMYVNYKFKKAVDSNVFIKDNTPIISQLPLNIIGNWSLVHYAIQSNDSVFRKYSNDTLVIQQYQFHNSHWTPGYYTKEVNKIPFKFDMSISTLGNWSSTTKNNGNTIDDFGYWHWLDNSESHKEIYFDLPGCLGTFNYKINKLDADSLFIQNDNDMEFLNPTIFKFKRIK